MNELNEKITPEKPMKAVEEIETRRKVAEILKARNIMADPEEETPEVFQTETMSDIIATAAAITAKENNTETSQSSVQQYLTALDQDSSTNTNTQQKS